VKLHYVVACYLGRRRNPHVENSETYLREHLSFIRRSKVIDRATIVLNSESLEQTARCVEIMQTFGAQNTNLIVRDNIGFSYGAWNDCVRAYLDFDSEYFFLVEDDYIPASDEFASVFFDKMSPTTGYVASIYDTSAPEGAHASMSIGLLSASAAVDARNLYGEPLRVVGGEDDHFFYETAERNQVAFLNNIIGAGYSVASAGDTARMPFVRFGKIIVAGNQSARDCIVPILGGTS
jgi:hypothetical protein